MEIALSNVFLASLLAVVAMLVTKLWKNSQLAHLLWLLVLAKLITPPLWRVSLPQLAHVSAEAANATFPLEPSDWSDFSAPHAARAVPNENSRLEGGFEQLDPVVQQVKSTSSNEVSRRSFRSFIVAVDGWRQSANELISTHASTIALVWFAAFVSFLAIVVFRVSRFN